MARLPPWVRLPLTTDQAYARVHGALAEQDMHTVCESARCPNRHACWNRGTATVMILGDTCTRNCRFCAVAHGVPASPDPGEPARVAEAARTLSLDHVVVTSVTRDDLADGGASAFAETVRALRRTLPEASVELLVPDFRGCAEALDAVLAAGPDVLNHNLETVRRFQPEIRPQASYARSLEVLRQASGREALLVKSGLMLGFGETGDEIMETLHDLYAAGCRLLTLGQYLAPSSDHRPVARYLPPDEFDRYGAAARALGFAAVAAGPLVRSSYRAGQLMREAAGRIVSCRVS